MDETQIKEMVRAPVRQHRYGNGYFRGLCTIGIILL